MCIRDSTEGVQYTANAYGPNWKHLPLYDLALVRKSRLAYVEPNEAEFAAMEYKAWRENKKKARTLTTASLDRSLRGASSEVKQQARAGLDEDTIKPASSLKPHKSFEAIVTVLDKQETETAGVYIYHYGVPI